VSRVVVVVVVLALGLGSLFVACAPTLPPVNQEITTACPDCTRVYRGSLTTKAGAETREQAGVLLSEERAATDASPAEAWVSLVDPTTAAARCAFERNGSAIGSAVDCTLPVDHGAWVPVLVTGGRVEIGPAGAELEFTADDPAFDGGARWQVRFRGREIAPDAHDGGATSGSAK
jgi:hypothetical protein